jgi:hypothetical protein
VYIKAVIDYEASAGDPGRLDKALDEMHYVIQSRDGKFVMLRLRRDPNLGTCKVLGVAMNVQETIVAIQDVDGNEKLMTYNGGVNKSLQRNQHHRKSKIRMMRTRKKNLKIQKVIKNLLCGNIKTKFKK